MPAKIIHSSQARFYINGIAHFREVFRVPYVADHHLTADWYYPSDEGDPQIYPDLCEFDGNSIYFIGYSRLPNQIRRAVYQCPICHRYKTLESQTKK